MNTEDCLICDSLATSVYIHLKSNNLVALKCKQCGHIFVKNSPITSDNIADYYTMADFKGNRLLQELEYPDYYTDCFADYNEKLDSSLVLEQFHEKTSYFESVFPHGGRLLDVGCATGVFLDMMKKRGWDVEGVEISDELASYARKTFSLNVHVTDLTREKINSEPFHVITLFDVIEHIPDPNLMIAACRDLLVEDGVLLLRTPTEEGLLRDIAKVIYRMSLTKAEYPMLWFYSFEHIHSFSLNTLNAILKKNGFSISKVFREEESFERVNVPEYVKVIIKSINLLSSLLNKQHKITVIAKKS